MFRDSSGGVRCALTGATNIEEFGQIILAAGGGAAQGKVVGKTTSDGGEVLDNSVSPEEILATNYYLLGISIRRRRFSTSSVDRTLLQAVDSCTLNCLGSFEFSPVHEEEFLSARFEFLGAPGVHERRSWLAFLNRESLTRVVVDRGRSEIAARLNTLGAKVPVGRPWIFPVH